MSCELKHYGVKGMKWGVRRYQNKDGTRTSAGKKRYNSTLNIGSGSKSTKLKRKQKPSISSLFDRKSNKSSKPNTEMTEQQKKEAYEAAKKKAVESGSAAEVLKFKGKLTTQEMQYAMSRIQWEQNMKNISDKEIAASKQGVDNYIKNLNKAVDVVTTTSKAYNTFANIYNAFGSTSKPMLPKIDLDNSKGNRAQRRAEKKAAKDEAKAIKKESKETNGTKENVTSSKSDKYKKEQYSTSQFESEDSFGFGKDVKSATKSRFKLDDISDVVDVKVTTINDNETATRGKQYIDNTLKNTKFDTSTMFELDKWK